MLDPNVELEIERKRKEDRTLYETIFSDKWVEHAMKWVIIGIGGAVLAALMRLILIS